MNAVADELRKYAEGFGGDEFADGLREAAEYIEDMDDGLVVKFRVIKGQSYTMIPVNYGDEIFFASVRRQGKRIVCGTVFGFAVEDHLAYSIPFVSYIPANKAIRKKVAAIAREKFVRTEKI